MHRRMQIMKLISNHAVSKSLLKQKTQLIDLKSQLTEFFQHIHFQLYSTVNFSISLLSCDIIRFSSLEI